MQIFPKMDPNEACLGMIPSPNRLPAPPSEAGGQLYAQRKGVQT